MKRLFLVFLTLSFLVSLSAQEVKIEFVTPSIVHVTKGQPTKSLVVTAKSEGRFAMSSDVLTVKKDPKTGCLTFLTAKGKVLLREKSCDIAKVSQTFLLDKDEAIYGLGTIQDGKMNRRGERQRVGDGTSGMHKRMEQSNLEDFQNVLQSIKGWGLYWENYSPTQFDDDANGMTFTSEAGEGIDYYFMYGGSADGVIAQMRYLTGDVLMFPLWTYGFWQSKEATRPLPKRRASSISIVRCRCLSTASSRTGSTGVPIICGTPWTSSRRILRRVRSLSRTCMPSMPIS